MSSSSFTVRSGMGQPVIWLMLAIALLLGGSSSGWMDSGSYSPLLSVDAARIQSRFQTLEASSVTADGHVVVDVPQTQLELLWLNKPDKTLEEKRAFLTAFELGAAISMDIDKQYAVSLKPGQSAFEARWGINETQLEAMVDTELTSWQEEAHMTGHSFVEVAQQHSAEAEVDVYGRFESMSEADIMSEIEAEVEWPKFLSKVVNKAKSIGKAVVNKAKSTVKAVASKAKAVGSSIKKHASAVGKAIKNKAAKVGNAINKVKNKVGGKLSAFGSKLKKGIGKVGKGLKNAAKKVGGAIKKGAKGYINTWKKIGSAVGSGLKKVGKGLNKGIQFVNKAVNVVGKGLDYLEKGVGKGLKFVTKITGTQFLDGAIDAGLNAAFRMGPLGTFRAVQAGINTVAAVSQGLEDGGLKGAWNAGKTAVISAAKDYVMSKIPAGKILQKAMSGPLGKMVQTMGKKVLNSPAAKGLLAKAQKGMAVKLMQSPMAKGLVKKLNEKSGQLIAAGKEKALGYLNDKIQEKTGLNLNLGAKGKLNLSKGGLLNAAKTAAKDIGKDAAGRFAEDMRAKGQATLDAQAIARGEDPGPGSSMSALSGLGGRMKGGLSAFKGLKNAAGGAGGVHGSLKGALSAGKASAKEAMGNLKNQFKSEAKGLGQSIKSNAKSALHGLGNDLKSQAKGFGGLVKGAAMDQFHGLKDAAIGEGMNVLHGGSISGIGERMKGHVRDSVHGFGQQVRDETVAGVQGSVQKAAGSFERGVARDASAAGRRLGKDIQRAGRQVGRATKDGFQGKSSKSSHSSKGSDSTTPSSKSPRTYERDALGRFAKKGTGVAPKVDFGSSSVTAGTPSGRVYERDAQGRFAKKGEGVLSTKAAPGVTSSGGRQVISNPSSYANRAKAMLTGGDAVAAAARAGLEELGGGGNDSSSGDSSSSDSGDSSESYESADYSSEGGEEIADSTAE